MTTNDLGLKRISPSMLMQYRACPRLFYYESWLGLKLPQEMQHLDFGTAIHAAIDTIYEGRNENGTWSNDSSAYKALEVFNSKFLRTSCQSDQQFAEMVADGIEIIRAYWAEKDILLAKGIDLMYNPETKEPLEIPLSYRLDCIAKNHKVVEFKTSSTVYDEFEVRARPQSLCYVWAYYNKHGVIPTLDYVVMRKKIKKNKIQHLSFVYVMADLMAFDAEVRTILNKIRNREFSRPVQGHFMCNCTKYDEALNYQN